jgi:NADP-dependent 3-hydroxy acid dehydrogenase YdfG
MSEDLAGRTVLVTGASSGIGRATALLLDGAGAAVFATGRNEAALRELASASPRIRCMAGDLTEPRFVETLVEAAGIPDILINNAGTLRHAPFLDSDPRDWASVFDTNVLSLLRLTQLVGRGMVARGSGHIINVSSLLARRVSRYAMIYAASKHAVAAICAGLRIELGPHGVKVTEIAPGLVATQVMRTVDSTEVRTAYAARQIVPLSAEDIARAILYAASTGPVASPDLIEVRPQDQT